MSTFCGYGSVTDDKVDVSFNFYPPKPAVKHVGIKRVIPRISTQTRLPLAYLTQYERGPFCLESAENPILDLDTLNAHIRMPKFDQ